MNKSQTTTDVAYSENLQSYLKSINLKIEFLSKIKLVERLFKKDHTLWSDIPVEISDRLGWIDSPNEMLGCVDKLEKLSTELIKDGIENIILLGMGGSSLSSEVFKNCIGIKKGYPNLTLLDSTDPDCIFDARSSVNLSKTVIIVSTKSGSTVETISLLKYFYNQFKNELGNDAGNYFIAITDPGSELESISKKFKFRKTFLNNPDVGGRFSVISYFGLIPAALIGVDIKSVIQSAVNELTSLKDISEADYINNIAIRLGAAIGVLGENGRNKLTFCFSDKYYSFGYWIEQLIAESTGKGGKGILPVLDQSNISSEYISDDRFFILLSDKNDNSTATTIELLNELDQPYINWSINNIGREFIRFEIATAIVGHIFNINPFDQPDVESAKSFTRDFLEFYKKDNRLDLPSPFLSINNLDFICNESINDLKNQIFEKNFGYIAIHAYLNPSSSNTGKLMKIRSELENISKLPVTLGFGPRFLHSTGQLHKGDCGEGLFIQIISENETDIEIPDEIGSSDSSLSFSILKKAQAIGDFKALDNKSRTVISIYISSNVYDSLDSIINMGVFVG